ncbi:MAG TPA: nucleotide sugar dehydrogenase [candidate division Zixibacteria bacterium]|nr:nucleotide sugar dehydrogenase [candidate division Zixibacteria bacterium]
MTTEKSILVVGAGFVGLATATFMANKGCSVVVAEKNPILVESLNGGKLHFHEPRLDREFRKLIKTDRLTVDEPHPDDFASAGTIVIAIDSADQKTWKMKLSAFERMAGWIGSTQRKRKGSVILKSTNVLGFAEMFAGLVARTPAADLVEVTVAPEFLREGFAYEDTASPWRVVIGTPQGHHGSAVEKLLKSLYPKRTPFVVTDLRSAELVKLGSNLYLSHRLAFINELAEYARVESLDMEAVREGIGRDPRIGLEYFTPGLGFGGSCLPKDCHLINSSELEPSFDFQTAYTALLINDQILEGIIERLKKKLGSLKGKRIAILGVAFKPETDDTRGSQAVKLAQMLRKRGAKPTLYDPYLKKAKRLPDAGLDLCKDISEALKGSRAVVVGCAHAGFKKIKPTDLVRMTGRKPVIIDYFGIFNRKNFEKQGMEFL